MKRIEVHLGERSYDIRINDQSGIADFFRSTGKKISKVFLVGDTNTSPLVAQVGAEFASSAWPVHDILIPAGEASKSLAMAERVYDELASWPADRHTLVLAIGGGVVGDLAGFVAATYNRGLLLGMVPTTLLAMVDSSVGGKVGINHRQGKNLIGAFHQPAGVWIVTDFLHSLPEREYRSGLAEVIKYGVILDDYFFAWLENHRSQVIQRDREALEYIVARSCELKANVVEKDEREETGLRMILNYGHTFAHAFETVAGYGTWLHGEAVAAGMICASRLARALHLIDGEVLTRQIDLLRSLELPVTIPASWHRKDLLASMYRDKKTVAGSLRFILPTRLGEVKLVSEVSETLVEQILEESR